MHVDEQKAMKRYWLYYALRSAFWARRWARDLGLPAVLHHLDRGLQRDSRTGKQWYKYRVSHNHCRITKEEYVRNQTPHGLPISFLFHADCWTVTSLWASMSVRRSFGRQVIIFLKGQEVKLPSSHRSTCF